MYETNSVSLLDLFRTYWFYPFPHLALFILIAIPVEAYCLFKKGSKKITACIIALSMSAVLVSIYWSFLISGRSFEEGERVVIPEYYPFLFGALLMLAAIVYSFGVKDEVKKRKNGYLSNSSTTFFNNRIPIHAISLSAIQSESRVAEPRDTSTEPVGAGQSQLRRRIIREPLEPLNSQAGMPVFIVLEKFKK